MNFFNDVFTKIASLFNHKLTEEEKSAILNSRGFGMGWKPDIPDIRDLRLSQSKVAIKPIKDLPTVVSIKNRMPPVKNQGDCSACVGFSTAAAVGYLRRTDKEVNYDPEHSALFAYWVARLLEDENTKRATYYDQGAYIRNSIKALVRFGNCVDTFWPFVGSKINKEPSWVSFYIAKQWKLGKYYRCSGSVEVLNALANWNPVLGGFSCYDSMFTDEVQKTGNVPMPRKDGTDKLQGGHAVCFVGYDLNTNRVEFINSWGPEWGNKGYGTLPLEFLDNSDLSDDFWCPISEA